SPRTCRPCCSPRAPVLRPALGSAFVSSFFFNDTATTEIYTLSLHDALPIFGIALHHRPSGMQGAKQDRRQDDAEDRKSTRLNSSHTVISYAVFCLKNTDYRQVEASGPVRSGAGNSGPAWCVAA